MLDVEGAMRQTLVGLSLTSTADAHAVVPIISGSAPDSRPPSGGRSPAEHWGGVFNAAVDERARVRALCGARAELSHLRRRRFAVGVSRDGDDLRERVLAEGEGAEPEIVAVALRCTPTLVRRLRLSDGRDAEHGRSLSLDELDPRALHAAGFSLRAIELVTGRARSTLHDQLSTHHS